MATDLAAHLVRLFVKFKKIKCWLPTITLALLEENLTNKKKNIYFLSQISLPAKMVYRDTGVFALNKT